MDLQDELAEPAQFCELLVTGAVEEAADPSRRQTRFPALQPGRLGAALARYREVDAHAFSLGHNHPRMPQVCAFQYLYTKKSRKTTVPVWTVDD